MSTEEPGSAAAREPESLTDVLSVGAPGTRLIETLTAEEAATVKRVLARTRQRRGTELEKSIQDMLEFLPRMLRKPVRAALFPGNSK